MRIFLPYQVHVLGLSSFLFISQVVGPLFYLFFGRDTASVRHSKFSALPETSINTLFRTKLRRLGADTPISFPNQTRISYQGNRGRTPSPRPTLEVSVDGQTEIFGWVSACPNLSGSCVLVRRVPYCPVVRCVLILGARRGYDRKLLRERRLSTYLSRHMGLKALERLQK